MHYRRLVIPGACALLLSAGADAAPTTEEKLDMLANEVEQLKDQIARDGGDGAASAQAAPRQTTIGGYGELHYNNLETTNQIDFHRFVLFFGHQFTDRIRFFSELELEHSLAGEGKPGEVELEQAYIEFDLAQQHAAKAGLFIVPVGILNETHEPPTFYGVERNPVETNIVPTTWWEAGLGLSGKLAPAWSYDLALTSGLNVPTTGANAYKIRNGRQKVANATANDGAVTGRIKWTGIPGIEWAATAYYQEDMTQGIGAAGTAASGALLETHAIFTRGPFALRALYAQWDLDSAAAANGPSPGRDKQHGWYVEPAIKLTPKLGVFARHAQWDNNAGSGSTTDTAQKQTNVGLNFWPHEQVVLKADVQQGENGVEDGFNLGVGYMF